MSCRVGILRVGSHAGRAVPCRYIFRVESIVPCRVDLMIVSCRVCNSVSHHLVSCRGVSELMSCRVVSCRIIFCVVSCRAVSHPMISYPVSCRVVSHPMISRNSQSAENTNVSPVREKSEILCFSVNPCPAN